MTVYAVIVSYNPDMDILKKCVQSVVSQVEKLLIIDNASVNQQDIVKLQDDIRSDVQSINVICNKENIGVASALNIALDHCSKNNVEWLLTLDQDSVVPDGMISTYKDYCKPTIGQICCNLRNPSSPELTIDKMSPLTIPINEKAGDYFVYACITSGTLLNVVAAKKIGGFNDELFIDYVDYDISLNLLENEYQTLYISEIYMEHSFGSAEEKTFFGRRYTDYNFAPRREYYKAKNGVYMIKRYPKFKKYFKKALRYDFLCPFLGFRVKCTLSFIKGYLEGIIAKVE